jgi:hypothetical protein
MGIVWHFAPPGADVDPFTNGPAIVIEGGYVAAGPSGAADKGVIHLRTHVPQLIAIRDVQGITSVPIIANSGRLNLNTYFTPYVNAEAKFKFDIENNLAYNTDAIPQQLLKFIKVVDSGVWTPVVRGSMLAGTYELAASSQCSYQKVGKRVTVWGHIVFAAAVTGGGTGNVRIDGLPFNMSASQWTGSNSASLKGIAFTGSCVVVERVSAGLTTTLYVYGLANNGVQSEVPIANVGVNDSISFELSYLTT